jgi:orotidine-5'-phosphate decarboxylase
VSFDPGNRLIAAIDVPDRAQADALVAQLAGVPAFHKIGLELFCSAGPSIVEDYVRAGRRVMLDLKLHDIPETVKRTTERVAQLGASLLTVHASGGPKMLADAVAAVRGTGTKILAVTALTSLDAGDVRALGVDRTPEQWVRLLAEMAMAAGCDGVVASPSEVAMLRSFVRADFLLVTPGIRPADAAVGDQKRVADPRSARRAGSDLLVVGRPLRDAADPANAAAAIAAEIAAA